jgi:hypothetical protein
MSSEVNETTVLFLPKFHFNVPACKSYNKVIYLGPGMVDKRPWKMKKKK